MKILYAADGKFRELFEYSLARTKALGYDCKVYDLGGLGTGEVWEPRPADERQLRFWKPRYMQKALASSEEPICWLDSDSFLLDRIDEIGEDCDVAVPLLPKGKVAASPIWFNKTDAASGFLKEYIAAANQAPRGDMYGLRWLFGPTKWSLDLVRRNVAPVIKIGGARVRLLDSAIYLHKMRSVPGDKVDWRVEEDIEHVPDYAKIVHISPRAFTKKDEKDQDKIRIMRAYEVYSQNQIRSSL